MSSRWQDAFARLKDFIKANPDITIGDVVIAIPGEVRPEFYRLFDEVRTTFVEDMFPGALKEAEILGENYRRVEQEVKELLNLEGIYNLGALDRYLREPTKELTRELFTPMFDLVKGRISLEVFEQAGIRDIEPVIERSQRLGYAKWVALCLVKQLEADKVFAVTPPESKLDGHGEPLCCEMAVAFPEELKYLTFEPGANHYPPFITPHFIIHSAKLNKYVSFRSEMMKAEYISLNCSEKREWYRISSLVREYKDALNNPSLLMYVSDELGDLALIADKDRMSRPDIIVDIREPGDWNELDTPVTAKLYDVLNPSLGRYIISRNSLPEKLAQQNEGEADGEQVEPGQIKEVVVKPIVDAAESDGSPSDQVIEVGYDESRLLPIVETLIGVEGPDKLAGQEAAQ